MARDLISDVEKILKSNNAYLKKKAALATIRLLKKEPDLVEHITERIAPLLKDRAHGVLITALQLLTDIFDICPEQKEHFAHFVPILVRLLKSFISMGFSPEHDVGGITDPFMQVKLLNLLRQLGSNNSEASEQMNDVLAQVATNTESAKNSGNAILYECVKTIMGVQSDSGLRTLAINILGRFLLNRDNNIRYVALHSLGKVVNEDNAAVQRHRATIVECLKDPDISIRQRALELVYQLVNPTNVESLTSELLNYLIVCLTEHKANLVTHIMSIVENYSPSPRWRINTIITMLSMAGKQCDETVISTCIMFLSQSTNQHKYIVHRIYRALQDDTSQTGLLHVGIWCIGEYGDLLLSHCAYQPDTDIPSSGYPAVADAEVVITLNKWFKLHNAEIATKALLLNALMKLTVHVSSPSTQSAIQSSLEPFRHSMNLELQQRSNEYSMLIVKPEYNQLRKELLVKIPLVDEAAYRRRKEGGGLSSPTAGGSTGALNIPQGDAFGLDSIMDLTGMGAAPSAGAAAAAPVTMNDSLMDLFGGPAGPVSTSTAAPSASANKVMDLFGSSAPLTPQVSSSSNSNVMDLFGSGPAAPAVSLPTPPAAGGSKSSNILDLFNTPSAPLSPAAPAGGNSLMGLGYPAAPASSGVLNDFAGLSMTVPSAPALPADPVIPAYDKGGLQITLYASKPEPGNPSVTRILCKFSNSSQMPFSSLVFQVSPSRGGCITVQYVCLCVYRLRCPSI